MNHRFFDLLTIVIPIYRRVENVHRLTEYYAQLGCKIIFADNSEEPLAKPGNLTNVDWVANSKWKFFEKYLEVLKSVTTPYVLICADDDFVVRESIAPAIEVMETNTSVVLVNGYHFRFDSSNSNEIKFYSSEEVLSKEHSNRHIIKLITDGFESEDPWERMGYNLKYIGGIDYSLYRTNTAVNAYKVIAENKQFWPINCTPFIICLIASLEGNIRYMAEPWLLKNLGERIIEEKDIEYPFYLQRDFSLCRSLSEIDFAPLYKCLDDRGVPVPKGYNCDPLKSLFSDMCKVRNSDKSGYAALLKTLPNLSLDNVATSHLKAVREVIYKYSDFF